MRKEEKIIGHGTWYDKIAAEIIERERKLGRRLDVINVESGVAASGIPHIGSFSEVTRNYAVSLAIKEQGFETRFILFSDNKDGLRSVPAGMPDSLKKYLGFPVTDIPDPFGCHESYGDHMISLLIDAIEEAGIEYTLIKGSDAYAQGLLNEEIRILLENAKRVGQIVKEETGQEKYLNTLPYFAICKKCGRIYTTKAIEYDPVNKRVRYECIGTEIKGKWHNGCGYSGWAYIDRGDGKLAWKVEFAARWRLLDIRFEAYGKDIADSVRVNDRISREILNYEPPLHVRYEMFLDESGRKVSKSRGNVFTPQLWMRYGSPESLILYLLKRFVGTRRISLNTIVYMMRELDYYKDIYYGRVKVDNEMKLARIKGLLEYTYKLGKVPDVIVPYDIILSLAEIAPEGKERKFIISRLRKYGYKFNESDISDLIQYAINWVREVGKPPSHTREVKLDEKLKEALRYLTERLKGLSDGEQIQGLIFETARKYKIPYRDFFKTLYIIITGRDFGPRLGPLIADIGTERVISLIEERLH